MADLKLCWYLRFYMKYNTFYFLRRGHLRYVKCLVTNIQKYSEMIKYAKISQLFKKTLRVIQIIKINFKGIHFI